jgi:hypothetical protein
MDSFKERERAAEALFIKKLEATFLKRMKNIWGFGRWASGLMGFDEAKAVAYQEELCHKAIAQPDDNEICVQVRNDLCAAGLDIPARQVERALEAGGSPGKI